MKNDPPFLLQICPKLCYFIQEYACLLPDKQGFGSAFFFADPDPGKNLHADTDPDPVPDPDLGGIRGRGLGVKGKNDFFLSFFHVSDDS